jgi:hypothetical protein
MKLEEHRVLENERAMKNTALILGDKQLLQQRRDERRK